MQFILLTLVLLAGCGHHAPRDTASDSLDFPIIDAHAHFNHPENNHAQPAADFLKEMTDAGVVAAVVHFEAGESEYTKVNRKAPIQLAMCADVVPGMTPDKVRQGLMNGKFQCMKIYLGYVALWATDKFYRPFYKLAAKYKVPVVFHTGDTYQKGVPVKYADPLQVDDIAIQYPDVKFVIAHMGNPWIQSAAEVVMKNDNVYTDVSAFVLGDASTIDPERIEEIVVKPIRWFFLYVDNPKKFLFGSDWPLLRVRPYIDVVKRAIPKQHWKAVFHDNAAELFALQNRR